MKGLIEKSGLNERQVVAVALKFLALHEGVIKELKPAPVAEKSKYVSAKDSRKSYSFSDRSHEEYEKLLNENWHTWINPLNRWGAFIKWLETDKAEDWSSVIAFLHRSQNRNKETQRKIPRNEIERILSELAQTEKKPWETEKPLILELLRWLKAHPDFLGESEIPSDDVQVPEGWVQVERVKGKWQQVEGSEVIEQLNDDSYLAWLMHAARRQNHENEKP